MFFGLLLKIFPKEIYKESQLNSNDVQETDIMVLYRLYNIGGHIKVFI